MAKKPKPPQPNLPPEPNPPSQASRFWTSVTTTVIATVASTVIISLLGWTFFYFTDYIGLLADRKIDTKLQSAIEKIDAKLAPNIEKLDTLGQRVAKIEGRLEGLKIQSLAMQPKKGANAKQASEILNTAKKEGTSLDPKVITVAGQEFISAGVSSSDPDVWKTGLAFLGYRSFLNSALAPPTDKFAPRDKVSLPWKFKINVKAQAKFQYTLATGEIVPAEKSAVLEPIDSPLNVGEKVGFEYLVISDPSTTVILDGLRLKNIIFKDIKIQYEGGKVQMENVYFVNCTFEVFKKPNGKNFASTVLASAPATTFQAGG